jgi:5-methyltetrahydrofolate--homocysteine methyltransferase
MNPILEDILVHAPVLTDGALGTQLQARELQPGECPDAWNLSRPAEVEAVIRSYVEAGSEIVLTNTFRANRIALAGYGLAQKIEDINLAGVEIARRAAAGRAAVFASVGPSGKMFVAGEVAEEDVRHAFAEQAQILAAAGVDGFAIETMSDLEEAKVAVAALRETGLPVVVSLVFDSGKDKDRTMTGVTPEQAAQELTAAGADVIGANCGQGPAGYIPICRRMSAATDLPLWIKPNAGIPELIDGRTVYRTTPGEFAVQIPSVIEAGASFVGGCCGTTPDFIRALASKI